MVNGHLKSTDEEWLKLKIGWGELVFRNFLESCIQPHKLGVFLAYVKMETICEPYSKRRTGRIVKADF